MVIYFLFICENYYPAGGAADYVASFPSVEEAQAAATVSEYQFAHIATVSESGELVIVSEWPKSRDEHVWSVGMADWRKRHHG